MAATLAKFISADRHGIGPANLFVAGTDRRFDDRANRADRARPLSTPVRYRSQLTTGGPKSKRSSSSHSGRGESLCPNTR
jgi:hypothetical protein